MRDSTSLIGDDSNAGMHTEDQSEALIDVVFSPKSHNSNFLADSREKDDRQFRGRIFPRKKAGVIMLN